MFGEPRINYTLSWCIKREVKNGKSCAFGARLGFLYAIDNKISLQDVNDFKFLEELFTNSNIENYIDVTNELKEKLYQKQYKIKITI